MNVPRVLSQIESLTTAINDLDVMESFAFQHPEAFSEIKDKLSQSPMMVIAEGKRALESKKKGLEKALENTEVDLPE